MNKPTRWESLPKTRSCCSPFSYGFWVANYVAFNGDVCRDLAAQFLTLAENQRAPVPLMIGHRLMGMASLHTGDIAKGRAHYDHALALYDAAEHRSLATRFGQDVRVAILCYRSLALWVLGYPAASLADGDQALSHAREISHAATLMYALSVLGVSQIQYRNYAALNAPLEEAIVLANEKGAALWKACGMCLQGCLLALTGKAQDAIPILISGITAWRSTGSTVWLPLFQSYSARAHADLGHFDDAWRCIGEALTAVETNKETWFEAEANRIAGEISLISPKPDIAKGQAYFERALGVARAQKAKSWELRAAMSMARLWRDQGKREEARDLLASIYGWFTEGFETSDLKEARSLLNELAS